MAGTMLWEILWLLLFYACGIEAALMSPLRGFNTAFILISTLRVYETNILKIATAEFYHDNIIPADGVTAAH